MENDYHSLDFYKSTLSLNSLSLVVTYLNYFVFDKLSPMIINLFFQNIFINENYTLICGHEKNDFFYSKNIPINNVNIKINDLDNSFEIIKQNNEDYFVEINIKNLYCHDSSDINKNKYWYFAYLNCANQMLIGFEKPISNEKYLFLNKYLYIVNHIKNTIYNKDNSSKSLNTCQLSILITNKDNQLLLSDPFSLQFFDISQYLSFYNKFLSFERNDLHIEKKLNICIKEIHISNIPDHILQKNYSTVISFINTYTFSTNDITEPFTYHIIGLDLQNAIKKYSDNINNYKNIIENIQSVYYEILDNVIIEISPSVYDFLGYKREELKGKPAVEFFYSAKEREDYINKLRDKKQLKNQLLKLINKDNQLVYCLTNSKMVIENGKEKIIGSLTDITEMIKSNKELEKKNIELENLINNDLIGVIYATTDGEVKLCNELAKQYILIDENNCLLTQCNTFKQIINFDELLSTLNNTGKFSKIATITRDNQRYDFDIQASLINYPNSDDKRLLIFITDITEKLQINNELEQINLNFNEVIENIEEPLFIYDQTGTLLYANPKFYKYLNYQESELLNNNISKFTPKDTYDLLINIFKNIKKLKNKKTELSLISKSGKPQLYEAVFSCRYSYRSTSNVAVVLLHNIEERKMYEENLLKNINEKDKLIKEIHHRTKNNLQLILSLIKLNLQKNININNLNAITALRDIYEKVSLLSYLQNELYFAKNSNVADIKAVIVKETNRLIKDFNKKIQLYLDLPDEIIMHVDVAILFMLSYIELIYNSIIHAFPIDWENPTITVKIEKVNNGINLEIIDNGIGISALDIQNFAKTLGLSLVNTLITYQLGGTFDITPLSSTGTQASISLKNILLKK